MSGQVSNLYELLGVRSSATREEVVRAYHRKALQYHPDKYQGGDDIMKLLNEAKAKLSDPNARMQYDAELAENPTASNTDVFNEGSIIQLHSGTIISDIYRSNFEQFLKQCTESFSVYDFIPSIVQEINGKIIPAEKQKFQFFQRLAFGNIRYISELCESRLIRNVRGLEKQELIDLYFESFRSPKACTNETHFCDPLKIQQLEVFLNEKKGTELVAVLKLSNAVCDNTFFASLSVAVAHAAAVCAKYVNLETIDVQFRGGLHFLRAYVQFFRDGKISDCIFNLNQCIGLLPSIWIDFTPIVTSAFISMASFQAVTHYILQKDLEAYVTARSFEDCELLCQCFELPGPREFKYGNPLFSMIDSFRQMSIIEKYIGVQYSIGQDNMEVAYSYINAVAVAPSRSAKSQCFLLASRYLYQHMKITEDSTIKMATYLLLTQFVGVSIELSKFGTLPLCSQSALMDGYLLLVEGSKLIPSRFPKISNMEHFIASTDNALKMNLLAIGEQAKGALKRVVELCQFWPIGYCNPPVIPAASDKSHQRPLKTAHQTSIEEIVGSQIQTKILDELLRISLEQSAMWLALNVQYSILEGAFLRWIPEADFRQCHRDCMVIFDSIYTTQKFAGKLGDTTLSNLLDWDALPRDSDGWLSNHAEHNQLLFSTKETKIQGIEGYSLDLEHSTVRIHRLPCGAGNRFAMLTETELSFLLKNGFAGAYFSLDPPKKVHELEIDSLYHPFQQVVFYPMTWEGSSCMATLLYTDYILKMLTTGCEISSNIYATPRSAVDGDGFLTRLPPALLRYLQEPMQNQNPGQHGKIHRFWIEADPVYMWDEDNGYTVVDDPVMRVKTAPMVRNANGDLADANEVNDENEKTPETEFSRRFTEAYDAIAEFFPEFERLRQIAKVMALSQTLHGIAQGIDRQIGTMTKDKAQVGLETSLKDVRERLAGKWPFNNSVNVNNAVSEALRANNTYRGDPRYAPGAVRDLETRIRNQLCDQEKQQIKSLASQFGISNPGDDVTSYIRASLDGISRHTAPTALIDSVNNTQRAPFIKMKRQLNDLGISSENFSEAFEQKDFLGFVPSAMMRTDVEGHTSLVYGGVNLLRGHRRLDIGSGDESGRGGGSSGGNFDPTLDGNGTFVRFQRWAPGKPYDMVSPNGNSPCWNTVRARYWKERAHNFDTGSAPTVYNWALNGHNLERMRRGRAPLDVHGRSIELHHACPQRTGRPDIHLVLHEVTREQHAKIDPLRKI